MGKNPEERNKESKDAAESNVEQPAGKQDPTEPVKVGGAKEGKGTTL